MSPNITPKFPESAPDRDREVRELPYSDVFVETDEGDIVVREDLGAPEDPAAPRISELSVDDLDAVVREHELEDRMHTLGIGRGLIELCERNDLRTDEQIRYFTTSPEFAGVDDPSNTEAVSQAIGAFKRRLIQEDKDTQDPWYR